MPNKKKVVYLFGTGAAQAEASLVDNTVRLLMLDVKDGILNKIIKMNSRRYDELRNELTGENIDVEQLITLYDSSGSRKHKSIAKYLKVAFREEILERVGQLDNKGFSIDGKYSPRLYSALIDMHNVKGFDEKLIGIMTLNYEDLIERALQKVMDCINYSLEIDNNCEKTYNVKKSGIPILKLHGSFNWKNEFPISIKDNLKREEDFLWIPPGVEKQNDKYPFNILWGKARELLNCDILRIIGCSLSRNDWHLVSLLYTTQRLNKNGKGYFIEVIDYPKVGDEIEKKYPHLRIRKIYEIKEIRDYVFNSLYQLSSGRDKTGFGDDVLYNYLADSNIFDIWLRAKGEEIINRKLLPETSRNIFRDYIKER